MQKIMRITCAIVLQPIFNAYIFKGSTNFQSLKKSPVLHFSLVLFFFPTTHACLPSTHKRNTTTSSLFRYRFQHPFCCKTKLGGHFKGGVVPLSFFKVNVTGNIYKPERLVWPVKILLEKFNTGCFN